jgi:hypothetical protein
MAKVDTPDDEVEEDEENGAEMDPLERLWPGARLTLRLDAYLLQLCSHTHGKELVFGEWQGAEWTPEQKRIQRQLATLRMSFFAERNP